jgi:hypothetical protein
MHGLSVRVRPSVNKSHADDQFVTRAPGDGCLYSSHPDATSRRADKQPQTIMRTFEIIRIGIAIATVTIGVSAYALLVAAQTAAM